MSREDVMLRKVTPYLWFDGQSENAARFHVSLFPDSDFEMVTRSPADSPSLPVGMVFTIDFTISGLPFVG
jgi:predicted 3-demethylubiquinone-9 3-methyltransferase (glyoxalase superfamily)